MRCLVGFFLCAAAFAQDAAILRDLLDDDAPKRAAAAARVRELGDAERTALVAYVATTLAQGDPGQRRAAARACEDLGTLARAAAPALHKAARARDLRLRFCALEALGEVRDGSAATVEVALDATAAEDADVRGAGVSLLWDVGGNDDRVLDALIDALDDPEKSIRWRAAVAFRRREEGGSRGAAALGARLRDEDKSVRDAAIEALQAMGPKSEPAWRDLIGQLESKDKKFRIDCAAVLGLIGSKPELVVPRIVPLLRDEDWEVRSHAAWAIGRFKTGARLAIEQLEIATRDPNPAVRRTALEAVYAAYPDRPGAYEAAQRAYEEEQKWRLLRHYDHDLKAALADLTRQLKFGSRITRVVAANNLGDLRKDGRSAIPALLAALEDPDLDVRRSSLRALAQIRVADSKPLLRFLSAKSAEIREAAVEAILGARKRPDAALDAVVDRLADEAEDVRDQVRWGLEDLGPEGLRALVRGLGRAGSPRVAILEAMGDRDDTLDSKEAVEAIGKLLDDRDEEVRSAAAALLALDSGG